MRRRSNSKLKILLGLTLITLPLAAFAYLSPGAPTGYLNDFGALLGPEERINLEEKLVAFTAETGHEIAVVTIPTLAGETVEDFAVKLFAEWKIGRPKLDNGVLLLVARDERAVRIEVGYGLEGALTDAQSYWIIQNEIIPAFRAGAYYQGLSAATDKIMAAARGEVLPTARQKAWSADDLIGFGWLGFVIFLWLSSVLARSKSWWAGGVVGVAIGLIVGWLWGFVYTGLVTLALLVPLGLILDYFISRSYAQSKFNGRPPPWWAGGGGFGSGHGGGFGGFGGGHSGGGGASGRW